MTGAPAVLRFSRDRRGYEHFYLVQPASQRRGKGPARILYWFRTPPGVKVGRPPFDDEMRRRIEAQNPGVLFDWPRLLETPIPPPSADVERWRERRRAEKAEKAARAARRADFDSGEAADADAEVEPADDQPPALEDPGGHDGDGPADFSPPMEGEASAARDAAGQAPAAAASGAAPTEPGSGRRRRRRRRRRRSGSGGSGSAPGSEPPPTPPAPETSND
jgi:hypothetical protein